MADSAERERPAIYLRPFYQLVQFFISLITLTPTDTSLVRIIVSSKGTDTEYLTYVSAVFSYQPILAVVATLQIILMVCFFVGGLFFVLARMVGAFGGRKVQNLTTQYMRLLRIYTVSMIVLMTMNALSTFWLWGSTSYFADAVVRSEKIIQPEVNQVRGYVSGTVKGLQDVLSHLKDDRSAANTLMETANKEYREQMASHSEAIFRTVGLPTPSQLDSLKDFLTEVKQECAGDATCTANADRAETARAAIVQITETVFTDFGALFNESLIQYYLGPIIQSEWRILDQGDEQRIKTLKFLQSAVEGTRYPNVTSMGILGRMSPIAWLFIFGESLGTAASTAAIMMELVTAVSFTLGILNHDKEVPPTKRSFISNQAGIMLVVSTLFMWLFCILMMLSSLLFMLGGVISRKYICEPYKLEEFGFVDNIVLTLFLPRVDEESEVFHQAEYNTKALELYNTTLNPGKVFRRCGKNETLLSVTTLQDIRGSEASFLTGNPPRYLQFLDNGQAFQAAKVLTENWASLTGLQLQQLIEPVLALRDALTSKSGKEPIKDITTAKDYAHSWEKGRDALFTNWQTMKTHLAREMNRDHYNYVNGKVGGHVASMNANREQFRELLGSCGQVAIAYRRCFDIFCDAVLPNLNGVWFALWLVCLFFCGTIIFILKISRYLLRMDDYMYEGIEVEESIVSPPDDKTSGLSVSYAPSVDTNLPGGKYKWRRPRFDPDGRFEKFESNPFRKPDLDELMQMGMDESDVDLMRWQADRLRDFVPDKLDVEVKRVKAIRQRLGLLPSQPLPIGGQSPSRGVGRGGAPSGSSPKRQAPGAK